MNRITATLAAIFVGIALLAGSSFDDAVAATKAAKKSTSSQTKPASASNAAKAKPSGKAKTKSKSKASSASAKRSGKVRGNQRVTAAKPQVVVVPEPVVVPTVNPAAVAHDLKPLVKDAGEWVDAVGASPQMAGLAMAIVKDNDIVLEKGVGVVDKGTNTPVRTNTGVTS